MEGKRRGKEKKTVKGNEKEKGSINSRNDSKKDIRA